MTRKQLDQKDRARIKKFKKNRYEKSGKKKKEKKKEK